MARLSFNPIFYIQKCYIMQYGQLLLLIVHHNIMKQLAIRLKAERAKIKKSTNKPIAKRLRASFIIARAHWRLLPIISGDHPMRALVQSTS